MKEERIIQLYLILTLLFGGGVFLRKIIHRTSLENSPRITTNSSTKHHLRQHSQQISPSHAKQQGSAPQPGVRRLASIPRYLPPPRTAGPSHKLSPPKYDLPPYDEGHDLSKKLDDLDYQERKEIDFLKMKVGLSESEIHTLVKKRTDYQTQLQLFSTQEQQGSKQAGMNKKSLIQTHIQWMANYLGPENYYEFLNLTAE